MPIENTLNGEGFKKIITNAIKERESFILNKNSLEINVKSRIAQALNSSSILSSKRN